MHAHLSRHRQAEYMPPTGRPQENSRYACLARVLPTETGQPERMRNT
jgi:hypothetical protein